MFFLVNHALQSWLPTLLGENGFSLQAAGRWVAFGVVTAMVSNFVLPWVMRRGYRGPVLTAMLVVSAAMTAGIAFASGAVLIVLVVVGTMVRFPALQLLTLVMMDTPEVGTRRLGTATGMFFAAAEVGGFAGPLTMGLVRDATGELRGGVLALVVFMAVVAVIPLPIREQRQ